MSRFLIIEDNKMMTHILAQLLRKSTKIEKLLYATTAQQACSQLNRFEFDCIFLDLNLSKPLDGIEVLEFIHSHQLQIPVVIVSTDSEMDVVKQVIKYNPSDYLVKPISLQKVKRCIEKLRQSRQVYLLG
ncbi:MULTISPECIES: response regulator [Photobacterium]|uniref:Response regulatory domain-containing protein n=1 Tax=Photobacterium ganghwense TaxID=320778 RepID=A0A0J1JX69_9GAMM|nr:MULTISPECIES: response regulator [Photobacterium]KLV06892.1 hypothetical protein ABT57_18355 [Photobacterium ganghwense]MBV1841341.1 response regulator [Photobacterium ganghwense]PSU10573.1 response regulator [Photobacterium ganghwense]QSV15473.1 response regulator [Photobacterium ganghwense]